jgi:hypothetical protein
MEELVKKLYKDTLITVNVRLTTLGSTVMTPKVMDKKKNILTHVFKWVIYIKGQSILGFYSFLRE